ncbi:MAG TPA: DUF4293 domain-containing protein [Bacteroidales bacterium]|nr:DUF4293 domain-containing protein [Bacteroidales bacterium]
MIQRIQSLYLLLAVVAYVLLFFFPIAEFVHQDTVSSFSLLEITNAKSNSTFPLMIVDGLLAITCLVTIFLFKKRLLQIRITAVTLLVHMGFIAAVFYSADFVAKKLGTVAAYQTGMYIALIPLVLIVLAYRAIRKDEKMVNSSDRLR